MNEVDDWSLSCASSSVAKNYGTVTTHVRPGYLQHTVQKTDTLQGIALKYGTTVRTTRPTVNGQRIEFQVYLCCYGVYAALFISTG